VSIDWKKIKTEYISTDITYRELAAKYGIGMSRLGETGKNEKWPELRRKHQDRAVKIATQKIGDRQGAALAKEFAVMDKLTGIISDALEDEKQLYRHVAVEFCGDGISEQTERVFRTVNTKAIRDLTASLNSITKTKRDILGGTIVVDKADRERLRQADEKIAIDKEKASKEVEAGEFGVVILPAVEVEDE
jgi:hypothetical protein